MRRFGLTPGNRFKPSPGFEGYKFTYTGDEDALGLAAGRAFEQWSARVRSETPVFPPQTLLDSTGRPEKQIFGRLRSQRDEKAIILAE